MSRQDHLQRILFAKMLSEALSCPSLAKICHTKCDEDGTLQESITQAKVQPIDMVDQHDGSRGCNSRCDAWCSASRTAIAGPASLLLPSDWRTNGSPGHRRFLSFRFSSCLASIFPPSFSRASTLGCVLRSLARTLRLAFVRGCALSFAFRFVFGFAFAFLLAFVRLLLLAFPLGCPIGCHVF